MTNPFWRVWVDWNGNGTWGESAGEYREDVTGDVLELDWKWGRTLLPSGRQRRIEPARLDLTLQNHDLRYTPGNPQSPLAGYLSAGRRIWASFAYPCDYFAGSDGTDINGRIVPHGDSLPWVKETTGPAGLELSAGRVRPSAVAGGAIYTLDFGEADAHVGLVVRRSSNGQSGVVLRFLNQWDYLRVRFGETGTVLEDVTFGFPSALRRGDPLAAGVDYFIEIELHGSSVRLYATDLDAGTMNRRQILDGGGNATNLAATRHGIWHDGSIAATGDRFANFGGWRSFFHGSLVRISPERDSELGNVCRCQARDDLALLGPLPLYNLFNQRNLSSGVMADGILTWAGFSPNYRRVEAGQTLVATEPRALWRLSVESALRSLADEENGRIYMDGRGYFRLESAAHRQATAHASPRATLRDTSAAGACFSHLVWDQGVDAVENSVTFRYRLGESKGLQEIWRLRDVPAIPAGESRDFLAESAAYDVVDSIRLPSATTDYTANSRPDGTGDALTASIVVSLPSVADGGSGTGATHRGRGTVVRVENGHASSTAYLTFLRLRADRTCQALEPTSYRAEDAASQAANGLREGTVECRFIDNYETARIGAEARLADRSNPRVRLLLTIPNGNGANLTQIVHRVLSDRIKVVSSNPNIDGDFFIEGMELKATARTGQLEARWLVAEA